MRLRFLACAAPKLCRLHCGLQGSPLIAGRPQWQGHTPGSNHRGLRKAAAYSVHSEHSGCPFRCTRFGHRQACGGRRRLVAQNTNTNTEPQVQTRLAGLLQLHVKVVADRRPTTHDGIKTRTTGGGSVSGRFAEGAFWLHMASFRGLQGSSGAGRASAIRRGSRPAAVSALASSNAPQPRRVKGKGASPTFEQGEQPG